MKHYLLKNYTIKNNLKLNTALKKINKQTGKSLVVINDKNEYLGVLSDGDIRRSLIKGRKLSDKVNLIYKKKTDFFYESNFTKTQLKNLFRKKKIDVIPIVGKNKRLKNIFYIDAIEKQKKKVFNQISDTGVIIMSGGKGTRLKPFTNVLPKPLLPYRGKTFIENIIKLFTDFNFKNFFISIHYKSHLIKAFFKELNPKYTLNFIEEKTPLGTAGSLKLIKKNKFKYFFVSNCDTLIQTNLYNLFNFHRKNNNDLTMVVAKQKIKIPYGVCTSTKNKTLAEIKEKPKFSFDANTGFYLINSNMLKLIPKKRKLFHITDLIDKAQKLRKKIGIYKIGNHRWYDLGSPSFTKKS